MHDLAALGLDRDRQADRLQERSGPRAGGATTASPPINSPPSRTPATVPSSRARRASPSLTTAPCRTAALASAAASFRPSTRAAPPMYTAAAFARSGGNIRCASAPDTQATSPISGATARRASIAWRICSLSLFALGQGKRSDLPVAEVGFADIGQAGDQRRVLPGGGVGQRAPRRVRHWRGPRADDPCSGRGRPARLPGVYQHHLGAQPASGVRARGPDDARADHDRAATALTRSRGAVQPARDAAGQGRHRERAVVQDGGVEGGQRERPGPAAAGLLPDAAGSRACR